MSDAPSVSTTARRSLKRLVLRRLTFVSTALLMALLFTIFHLLGWRDDTAIFSGTSTSANVQAATVRGGLYALTYFSTVIVSPILILAAAIDLILRPHLLRHLCRPKFRAMCTGRGDESKAAGPS